MKLLAILALAPTLVFAGTKADYASFYIDQLIEDFDKELDHAVTLKTGENPLLGQTYARIQSGRDYLENGHDHSHKQDHIEAETLKSIQIIDTDLYKDIVNEINSGALKIEEEQIIIKKQIEDTPYIYPSAGRNGNVTGNTYPSKVWSLTFDDGPTAGRTTQVVDNLYNRNIKATFFMLVRQVNKYTQEAQNVVNSGMEVALHSYTHKDLNKASSSTLEYEIGTSKTSLENLLGIEIRLFRLPYGSGMRNSKVRDKIQEKKMVHLFWNVDTLDWKDKNPSSIMRRVKKQMKNSRNDAGVILFHDIHAQTVIASRMTMDYLIDSNYKVCTVGEVIDYQNGNESSCDVLGN